jgi:hypothetical protein
MISHQKESKMLTSITPNNVSVLQDFVRTGRVEQVLNASQIRVTLNLEKRAIELWAEFAMGNQLLPKVGDKVLVAGEDLSSGYIIGHFPVTRAEDAPQQRFTLEQDEQSGKTILSVPEGDLALCSEKGSIRLEAAKDIELCSPQFSLEAGKGQIKIADADYQGVRLGASIAQTKLFLGKLNTTIGRLIEKAKNVYRQVDNLNQLKAGRMRTLVKGSYHLKGESLNQKAEKDVRIDGNKINLG